MKLNNETIKSAVWDWFNNKNYAESIWSYLKLGYTGNNMSLLFGYRYDFNDD